MAFCVLPVCGVEFWGRPEGGAEDETVACEGGDWEVEFGGREEGAVDGRGPGAGGEDEMGTGKGCGFVG